jgi:hypothetical protein
LILKTSIARLSGRTGEAAAEKIGRTAPRQGEAAQAVGFLIPSFAALILGSSAQGRKSIAISAHYR